MTDVATKNLSLTFSQTCERAIALGLETAREIAAEFDLTRSMAIRVVDALADDRAYYARTVRS